MTESIRARGPWQLAFERLRGDRWAIVAAAGIAFIIVVALFAPWIAAAVDHSPEAQFRETGLSPSGIPVGPGREFLFGTDGLGRDVLVRIAYGARVSLVVGVVASGLAVAVLESIRCLNQRLFATCFLMVSVSLRSGCRTCAP